MQDIAEEQGKMEESNITRNTYKATTVKKRPFEEKIASAENRHIFRMQAFGASPYMKNIVIYHIIHVNN